MGFISCVIPMNHLRSSSSPERKQTLTHTIRMMCFAILMSGTVEAGTKVDIEIKKINELTPVRVFQILNEEISGPEISKKFEWFTPRMKTDEQSHTLVIGHGTDVGHRLEWWPYASYALDVAEKLKQVGMSDENIRQLIHGEKNITRDTAEVLFEMRYERREKMIQDEYEKISQKKFSSLPEVVQKMLVDFSYNMRGEYGIFPHDERVGFPNACAALLREDWIEFANEIADSNYAREVGARRAWLWIEALRELGESQTRVPMKIKALSDEAEKLAITYRTKYKHEVEWGRYVSAPSLFFIRES